MAGKFARSWALMKASATVLRSDKSLLVFPLLSGFCTLLVAASFLIPVVVMTVGGEHAGQDFQQRMSAGAYLLMFAFYLVQYFVIIFFQTALTGVALMHLRGEPTSVGAGFALARSRLVHILGYALIAATVGLLLRMVQERLGLIGRLKGARRVVATGYTDSLGSAAANYRLGLARADAVCAFISHRAHVACLAVAYGESHPRATNATAAGRALNRRVELLLTY